MSDQSFTYDQTQSLTSNAFTRVGYAFNGWATSSDGLKQYDNGQTVSNLTSENGAEVTLYAKWSLVYYSLATSTTGTGSGTVSLSPSGGSYTNGVVVQVTANPASGSTFIQWSDGVTDNPRTYTMTSNISVSAVFAISTYTVTFKDYDDTFLFFKNCNHGETMPHPSADPSREGYVFKGWLPDPPDTVTRTAVYTAQYEAKSYTVRFHSNYGNGATESTKDQAFTYGTSQNLSSVSSLKFAKDGYTFAHWKEREGGQKYEDGEQVLSLADHGVVHFDAQWIPNAYTVKFDANGGTGEMADMDLVYDVETNLAVNGFSRTGYAFSGWATSKSADVKYADGAVVSNLTATANGKYALYAKWTANSYTVMLDRGGGTGGTGSTNAIYDSAMPNIAVPTRTGYKFGGYFTDPNGSGVQYYTQYGTSARYWDIASDTTLYAKWTANDYKVAFYGNGGYGSMPYQDFTYDVAQGLASNCFVKAGYSFAGWATNQSGTAVYAEGQIVSNLTAQANGTVYIYATWTANTYTVTLNANGGAVDPTSVDVTYDDAWPTLPTPTLDGYAFAGWYDDVEFKKATQTSYAVAVTNYTTIYAKWTANAYEVSFDKNSAEAAGNMQNEDFDYGVEKSLSSNAFTRAGYPFAGWATSADGQVEYTDGQIVSNLTTAASAVVPLFAAWTPIEYTIAFNGNGAESGSVDSIDAEYDISYDLPENRFVRSGFDFKGWRIGSASYDVGDSVSNLTTEAGATVTFSAVWSETRYVAFDGNGADNADAMVGDVITFDGVETKNLIPNRFEKTGYTFGGWATNETDAAALNAAYTDGADVVSTNLWMAAGKTNVFYAVWQTNTYKVVFKSNGGNGYMAPQTFVYDQPQALTKCDFSSNLEFRGWATNQEGSVVFDDQATVSNLIAEANGTVTLYAVWDNGDLSKAMHCDNLFWTQDDSSAGTVNWDTCIGGEYGYNPSDSSPSGSSVCAIVPGDQFQSHVMMPLVANGSGKISGKISFWYKMSCQNEYESSLKFSADGNETDIDPSVEWKQYGPVDVADATTVTIFYQIGSWLTEDSYTVWIDQMKWEPDGVEPTEDDMPTINGFTATVDGFTLSVDDGNINDSFSYQILATNELVSGDWPVKTNLTAEAIRAGCDIVPEANGPKMFYKVKVISK